MSGPFVARSLLFATPTGSRAQRDVADGAKGAQPSKGGIMRSVSIAIVSIVCVLSSSMARAQAPSPTGTHAKVLHLTASHIVIDQPGMYVLDRNWAVPGTAPIIEITADNVVFDLRGFSIELSIQPGGETGRGVYVAGDNVTLRNGRIVTSGLSGPSVLWTDGASTVIDTMQMESNGSGLTLDGPDGVVRNSSLRSNRGIHTHVSGDRYLIEGNRIYCVIQCLTAGADGVVRNNHLYRSDDTGTELPMVRVSGTRTTFENNYLENVEVWHSAIMVSGTQHVISNDTMTLTRGLFSGTAIWVDERNSNGNVLNGNIASHAVPGRRWELGLNFEPGSGDNFYGDNRMEANVPVLLQNTRQVDWGG